MCPGSNPQNELIWYLDRLSARFIQSRIIAVSDVLEGELKKELPSAKIRVIENGIDLALISGAENSRIPPARHDPEVSGSGSPDGLSQ